MAGPYTTELDALRNVIAGDLNTDQLNVAISSSTLPSGAATSAKQDTGNTSLASIDTKTPSLGQAVMASSRPVVIASNQTSLPVTPDSSPIALDRTATGNITTINTLVSLSTVGLSTVMATITGSWTGIISFQGSIDGGVTFPISVAGGETELLNGQIPVNATINGKFKFDTTGLSDFRMIALSGLTGTAVVTLRASQGAGTITKILDTVYTNVSNSVTTTNAALALAQASTTSGQTGPLVQTATTTAAPTYVTAKTNPISTNTSGEIRAVLSTNSSLAANQSVNVAQINGVAPLMGAGNTGTGSPRVTIATDQAILTNAWKSNTAQINGVVPLMGNGVTGTGSQRVTIASDNTAFAVNATLQTGANTIGALTANQSVNVAQINGVTTLMNNGIAGTGSQRVVIASDNTINTNSYSTRADTYTTTSNGSTVDISAKPMKNFSMLVKATGAVTSWDVRLEGSNDNSNFSQILAHTNVSPGDGLMVFTGATLSPCLYFRSRCAGLVLGAGTNVVVTILGMT